MVPRTKQLTLLAAGMAMLATTSAAWATHNPHLGRFMQRDPLGYPDGMNGYEYQASKPVASVDPNGQWVQPDRIVSPGSLIGYIEDEVKRGNAKTTLAVLELLAKKLSAGVTSVGTNQYVFTCEYGFLDMGHFWSNAKRAYKKGFRSAWRTGLAVERNQEHLRRLPTGDWGQSAWTPEDLPSNQAGALFGSNLKIKERKSRQRASQADAAAFVIADFRLLLKKQGVVQPHSKWDVYLLQKMAKEIRQDEDNARKAGRHSLSAIMYQYQLLEYRCFCSTKHRVRPKYRWRGKRD